MVSVGSIKMASFGLYDDALLELPETGLTLITGPNGSGKTTFMQAVSHGLWGKPVIGDDMWRDDEKSEVEICVFEGALDVKRWRTKRGTKSLKWGLNSHPTTSKGQADLEAEIGSMDLWRWSSVFVNDAPDLFTRATDKARKLLLEQAIPDLERFEPALKCARAKIKEIDSQLMLKNAEVAHLTAAATAATAAINASKPPRPTDDEVAAFKREYEALAKKAQEVRDVRAEVLQTLEDARYEADASDVDLQTMRQRITAVGGGECPTCGKPATPTELAQMQGIAARLTTEVHDRQRAAHEVQEQVRAMLAKVNARHDDALQAANTAHATLVHAQNAVGSHKLWAGRIAGDRKKAAEMEQAAAVLAVELEALTESRRYADAAQKVLGLQGARARVIGQALDAIDAAANRWLAELAGDGWGIELRAYREQKSGKVEEKIALKVQSPEHPGKWRGYWSSSSGQRRRFDLAVMLAIGDVVRGLRGGVWSTLFFDECLDALDEEGKRRAVAMLHDLARKTSVVVVSHDSDILTRLRPDQHIEVANGRVL